MRLPLGACAIDCTLDRRLAKVGFLACLHAISLERSRFRKNAQRSRNPEAVRGGHRPPRSLYCQISRLASRRTDSTATDRQYRNPRCACAPRMVPMLLHTIIHSLAIETGRFHKPRSLPLSDRLSILLHACGAEVHILTQPLSPCSEPLSDSVVAFIHHAFNIHCR